MPAPSLQSRIDAFESLARHTPPQILTKSPPKSPPNPLDAPISPTASSFASISPSRTSQASSRSLSSSPPVLGRKPSSIDLKDWVVDDAFSLVSHPNGVDVRWNGRSNNINNFGSPTPSLSSDDAVKAHSAVSISPTSVLINLESPPSTIKVPPLPPRKMQKSVSPSNLTSARNSCNASPLQSNRRPDNLTVEHTYPPLPRLDTVDSPRKIGHAPASSVSSFHSVSLSSDGGTTDGDTATDHISTFPMDREGTDADSLSLDESFEEVSASSIVSPTTAAAFTSNWETQYTPRIPRLSPRPPPKQLNASIPVPLPPKLPARRGPPPPPSRSESARSSLISTASDRSSILSTSTATTSHTSMSSTPTPVLKSSLTRPTPPPAAACKRYEAVFTANILQHRQASTVKLGTLSPFVAKKTRQAAGWRGLSVDLITNPEDHPLTSNGKVNGHAGSGTIDQGNDATGLNGKLDGHIVKLIWSKSRLDREKLRRIWNECDVSREGALDRDAFVKGMWRIDEELRKARTKSSGTLQNLACMHSPPPKPTVIKPILR